ncbi:MAG: DNA-processing protein DprA [Thioploca sp.]|nr:DNA-processing protein DprA [Thioploca sp.]
MNNLDNLLSPDTQATLLLCGHFGKKTAIYIEPLTPAEYAWLAQQLQAQNMRPADLLNTAATLKIKHFEKHKTVTTERLVALLMRGGALALAVETWTHKGLWVMSRSDKTYPLRLKKQLGQLAPPIFYGVGPPQLLQQGGLAVVGSREVDEEISQFTKLIAKKSAQQGITLLSGGARGVDAEAISTALIHGGTAVGVLSDNLARMSIVGKYREALREKRLVLISPFDPQINFNIGNAIARNKYIYALSDWALVVNSGYQEGGTWSGASENLKANWVPLFVRQAQSVSLGNQSLLNRGGIALDKPTLQTVTDLRQQLTQLSQTFKQLPNILPAQKTALKSATTNSEPLLNQPFDLFEIILPYLEQQLSTEKTESELAEIFNLHPLQLRLWLKRALAMGKVKKLTKPARYIHIDSAHSTQGALFE